MGIIKVRVSLMDLRKTRSTQVPSSHAKSKSDVKPQRQQAEASQIQGFVPQTAENTIDLRGIDADQAIERTLNFLDKCLRTAQPFVVLIHGHGSDRLKNAVRAMLKLNCPYNVKFRPGEANEGGDGVTVVSLQ